MYFHLMHILSKHYHVYVLDVRNQGLSQRVPFGNRIARYAMDVKEFAEHVDLAIADFCGWSMGASIMWAYIGLFGTQGIRTLSIIDQAPSIYCHADWTEQERLEAGAFTTSPERMIASYTSAGTSNMLISSSSVLERAVDVSSPYFHNAISLVQAFVEDDMAYTAQVLFDHTTNDWRDVIRHKIDVPRPSLPANTVIGYTAKSGWILSSRSRRSTSIRKPSTAITFSRSTTLRNSPWTCVVFSTRLEVITSPPSSTHLRPVE